MRNQICVTSGLITGTPTSAVSERTSNQYCNFLLATPGAEPDTPNIIPMVAFKMTAEYMNRLTDGDSVFIQYNVGSNTFTNEFGEERTQLSIFADEVYQVGNDKLPQAAVAMGNVSADPEMRFQPDGTAQCVLRVTVTNEWLGRDGFGSNESTLSFMFLDIMAEQVAQHVTAGMWAVIGFHVESRTYDRRDGSHGYNAFLAGDWYELDVEAGGGQGDQAFGADPNWGATSSPPQQTQQAAAQAAAPAAAQATQAFDPFGGDLPFE